MKTFKSIVMGLFLGVGVVLCIAQIGPSPPLVGGGGLPSTINNVSVISNLNLFSVTNMTVYDSVVINTNLTINNNLIVNNNISVSGKATFTEVIITNTTRFTTNAFPLSPGTTWDWSKYDQFITTNADFNITAIAGVTNFLDNMAQLEMSNSAASTIICHLTFALSKIGPNTTNDIYIGAGKEAYVSGDMRGFRRTNIVTLVEQ